MHLQSSISRLTITISLLFVICRPVSAQLGDRVAEHENGPAAALRYHRLASVARDAGRVNESETFSRRSLQEWERIRGK